MHPLPSCRFPSELTCDRVEQALGGYRTHITGLTESGRSKQGLFWVKKYVIPHDLNIVCLSSTGILQMNPFVNSSKSPLHPKTID